MARSPRDGGRVWWSFRDREREPPPTAAGLRAQLGRDADPVAVEAQGRAIARTFWGQAWCRNLERYSDYASRLPRGRTYVRSGAVKHLAIERGRVHALVMGTSLYRVDVTIEEVGETRWTKLVQQCAGRLSSLIDLLEGRLSKEIMEAVTERGQGLFPEPKEIRFTCSCPDWATMCKHVAAVLYGVGVRFDARPELLFELRGAEATGLVGNASALPTAIEDERSLDADLSALFGVTIDDEAESQPAKPRRGSKKRRK